MIEINPEGIEAVRRTFERLAPAAKTQALEGLAKSAFATAQHGVAQHTQTGALEDSLSLKPDGDEAWIIGHDLRRAPHALFVHWGTRPHVITHKDKQALRWVHGNGYVFAKFVRHPGYRGHSYLVEAADAAVRDFPRIVDQIEIGD